MLLLYIIHSLYLSLIVPVRCTCNINYLIHSVSIMLCCRYHQVLILAGACDVLLHVPMVIRCLGQIADCVYDLLCVQSCNSPQ